jgi:hypothetical protein
MAASLVIGRSNRKLLLSIYLSSSHRVSFLKRYDVLTTN